MKMYWLFEAIGFYIIKSHPSSCFYPAFIFMIDECVETSLSHASLAPCVFNKNANVAKVWPSTATRRARQS